MVEKEKAAIYVLSKKGLLVFAHTAHPEVGYQVPAGTVRAGEAPVDAAVRELEEETGLRICADDLKFLGIFEHDMRPFRAEKQLRHAFLLSIEEQMQDRWVHWEEHPDSPDNEPVQFQFHWEPLHKFLPALLSVGQGDPMRPLSTQSPKGGPRRLEYLAIQESVRTVALARRQSLARLLQDLQPGATDRLKARYADPVVGSLLEHVACMAKSQIQDHREPTPVFELLEVALEVPRGTPLLVLPKELCYEVAEHDYETPLYLATAEAIAAAHRASTDEWLSALRLLDHVGCSATVGGCLGVVIDLGAKKLLEPTNSYTLSGVPGTVYCEYVASELRLAETLLHEATHTWLNFAFDALQPGGFSDAMYWSPWRHKLRPAFGILQATFVFSLLCQFFDRCLASDKVGLIDKAYAESRLKVESQVLRDNLATLTQALEEIEDVTLRAVIAEDLNRALNLRPSIKEK
jgi:8-oxo-dGTP pyrophosphatase MutT (NUDIX family)